jgi:hypothetical protein
MALSTSFKEEKCKTPKKIGHQISGSHPKTNCSKHMRFFFSENETDLQKRAYELIDPCLMQEIETMGLKYAGAIMGIDFIPINVIGGTRLIKALGGWQYLRKFWLGSNKDFERWGGIFEILHSGMILGYFTVRHYHGVPFRELKWSTIHQHLERKILDEWKNSNVGDFLKNSPDYWNNVAAGIAESVHDYMRKFKVLKKVDEEDYNIEGAIQVCVLSAMILSSNEIKILRDSKIL